MRSSFLVACGLLLAVAVTPVSFAQASWNFSAATGAAATLPSGITSGVVSGGNGTIGFDNTSASSGYAGASGGTNASTAAQGGALSTTTSTYFQFTLTPNGAVALRITSVSLGSRSTASGPTKLTLFSSIDGFAAPLGAVTTGASSAWALVTFSSLNITGATGDPVTFRIYGSDGASAGGGNWRIDDLNVSFPPPTIGSHPQPQTANALQSPSFSIIASGTGTLSYQWRKNTTAITGATTSTLTLSAVTTADAGSYDVVVTDALASATSNAAALVVNRLSQTISFDSIPAKTFGDGPFAISASATSGLPPTFAVVSGPATISGNTITLTGAGEMRIRAMQAGDQTYNTAPNVEQTLQVAKATQTITFAPLADRMFGTSAFTIAATSSSGLQPTFSIVSGPATLSGNVLTLTGAGFVTVRASQAGNNNYLAALAVEQTFTASKAVAIVTLAPETEASYDGQPRPVSVTTTPSDLPVSITYSGTGATSYGPSTTPPTNVGTYSVTATINHTNYSGSKTASLVIKPSSQTITFAPLGDRAPTSPPFALTATASSGLPVVFSITAGSPDIATLAGNIVTLTGATGSVTIRASQPGDATYAAAPEIERTFLVTAGAGMPVITEQPESVDGFLGQTATLRARVTSYVTPTYQWQKNGADIFGANSDTFTIPELTLEHIGAYQLVVGNPAGTVRSNVAFIFVRKKPQTITLTPADTSVNAGTSITLAATATSGLPVTLTIVSGAATLMGNQLTSTGGSVIVRATQAGDELHDVAPEVFRTYSFTTGSLSPFITTAPSDQTVNAGDTATFRASAIGTPPPTLQWQKDGVAIAGATGLTLTLANVTVADTARYTIVATNPAGTASGSALLTVQAAPEILEPPASQTVAAGTPATFAVLVSGTPAPRFQWRKNGTAINGATNSTYRIANPAAADAGRFDVVVTNILGAVTSPPATLVVNTRDFTGQYFGRFTGAGAAAGEFAVHVRANRTAVFLGYLPGAQTGVAVTNLDIDLSGNFSIGATTLAAEPDAATEIEGVPLAAAPRPVTIRGRLDDADGSISGTVSELGVSFSGARAPRTGPAATQAGLYQLALLGSSSGRGYIILSPDGEALLLTASGTVLDGARGAIGPSGRLALTSVAQATVDLGVANGGLSGTVRAANGGTGQLAGALETLVGAQHVVNLSVRTSTSNAAPLITGFVISGTGAKQVLIRAAGPALAAAPFNVPGTLADPTLQVRRGNTMVAQNDEWGTPAANRTAVTAAATRVGAFPFRTGSTDAALVTSLMPGAYTVQIGGGNGTVLAEVYEVLANNEAPGARRLVNVSARGLVSPGAPVIAGFVISGTAPQRVLIRGVGPRLGTAPFNVAGVLANPQLTLFRGTTVVKTNDDWSRDPEAAVIQAAATRAGAFALGANSVDAAMLLFLEPGAYTAQVSGPSNASQQAGTGVVLVEVYESNP